MKNIAIAGACGASVGILAFVALGTSPSSLETDESRWKYATLEIKEVSYWGVFEKERDLLWLTPEVMPDGIHRASDPDKHNVSIAYPGAFFEAVGAKTGAPPGTEASLLSTIGRNGCRLIDRRDSSHDTSVVSGAGQGERKATENLVAWTFERPVR